MDVLAPRSVPEAARAPAAAPRWTLHREPPEGWDADLARCGGGFFHAPAALRLAAPPGEPVYARLRQGEETVGVAVGSAGRCRLGWRPAHLYLPALPALRAWVDGAGALHALAGAARERGAAEVVMDSYDSGRAAAGHPGRDRQEHRLALDADDALLARFDRSHRARARRGDQEGWEHHTLSGAEAVATVREAQGQASLRAHARGDGFRVPTPSAAVGEPTADPGAPWGLRTFAAVREGRALSVCVVGWGGGRAYYVMGGSTEEGYRCGAATWLHWRTMRLLRDHGCTEYNLGGTPAAAADPAYPSHGLYRFKSGFGADARPCRGARWELRPAHLAAHRVAARLADLFRPDAT
jgi:hypothetical protein